MFAGMWRKKNPNSSIIGKTTNWSTLMENCMKISQNMKNRSTI